MRAFVGAVALALLVAACSSSAKTAEPPTSTTSTTVPATCYPARPVQGVRPNFFDGRFFRVVLPEAYNGRDPVPLIVGFHGHGANKELFAIDTQLPEKGTAAGYAVVLVDGEGAERTWKMFDFNGPDNDYDQIVGLVEHLLETLCIDEERVFATGHSAGSAFAGFLVCREPYLFAGVAMVSATIPSLCPDDVAVATIGIHGAKDQVVLYNGGKGLGQEAGIPPFEETIAKAAARNKCELKPVLDTPQPGVGVRAFNGCVTDGQVQGVTIRDGGHPWPGGFQATHTEPVPVGANFNATSAILDFFRDIG